MSTASATVTDRQGQSRFVSVLLGAVTTVALSFLPFAPLVGGGVAGYLRCGDRREGVRVGAMAGVVASVPVLAVLGVVFGGFSLVSVVAGVSRAAPIASLFGIVALLTVLLVATLFVLVLVVGQSALGGWLAVVLVEQSGTSGTTDATDDAGDATDDGDGATGATDDGGDATDDGDGATDDGGDATDDANDAAGLDEELTGRDDAADGNDAADTNDAADEETDRDDATAGTGANGQDDDGPAA